MFVGTTVNRDVACLVVGFFLGAATAEDLSDAASFMASTARVSRVFAQAVHFHMTRSNLEPRVRLCRLFKCHHASKTLVGRHFPTLVDAFFAKMPPRTIQVLDLLRFADEFTVRLGPDAIALIQAAEDKPRLKRMRQESAAQERAAKQQRKDDRRHALTLALRARSLPIDMDHMALRRYCNGSYEMTEAIRAMEKRRDEQSLLAAFQKIEDAEVAELRLLTPRQREERLLLFCIEHKQEMLEPIAGLFTSGAIQGPLGFVGAAILLRQRKSLGYDGASASWQRVRLRAARKVLSQDRPMGHAWMAAAREFAKAC